VNCLSCIVTYVTGYVTVICVCMAYNCSFSLTNITFCITGVIVLMGYLALCLTYVTLGITGIIIHVVCSFSFRIALITLCITSVTLRPL